MAEQEAREWAEVRNVAISAGGRNPTAPTGQAIAPPWQKRQASRCGGTSRLVWVMVEDVTRYEPAGERTDG